MQLRKFLTKAVVGEVHQSATSVVTRVWLSTWCYRSDGLLRRLSQCEDLGHGNNPVYQNLSCLEQIKLCGCTFDRLLHLFR
jgi:hypothetical protein